MPSLTALPPQKELPLPPRNFPQRISSANREAVVYNQKPSYVNNENTSQKEDFRRQNGQQGDGAFNDGSGPFDENLLRPRNKMPDSPVLGRLRFVKPAFDEHPSASY